MISLHANIDHSDLPDAGEGMCCIGAAARGPVHCTCWTTEHDQEQLPIQHGAMAVRDKMCGDCAFRPGSPEQLGDPSHAHSGDGELDEVIGPGFVCHQGMRKRLRLVHPEGSVVQCGSMEYAPPERPGMTWKADGTPAEMCAGWAARRAQWDREAAEEMIDV